MKLPGMPHDLSQTACRNQSLGLLKLRGSECDFGNKLQVRRLLSPSVVGPPDFWAGKSHSDPPTVSPKAEGPPALVRTIDPVTIRYSR